MRGLCVVVVLGLLASASPGRVRAQSGAAYSFTLDGKPIEPRIMSLNGTPDDPAPGDVARLNYHWSVVLGEPGDYHFKSAGEEDGVLFLAEEGKSRVIAVTVSCELGETGDVPGRVDRWPPPVIVSNPLDDLSPEQIAGLRGVRLNYWDEGLAGQLAHADLERLCITIGQWFPFFRPFPELPGGSRYLILAQAHPEDFSALRELNGLRLFCSDVGPEGSFDIGLIAGNADLRYLRLDMVALADVDQLARCAELRVLELPWCERVGDVSFARNLPRLTRLDIAMARVKDLRPLSGLQDLFWVNADSTGVCRLPDGSLPKLRTLRVLSAPLTDEEVAAFAEAHPQCRVWHRWGKGLRDALAGADRIRVRRGGVGGPRDAEWPTLFEVTDPGEIRSIVQGVRIQERLEVGSCACYGSPTFEFYKAGKLLESVSLKHGRRLCWPARWPGDGELMPENADFFCRWLAQHGESGPLQERQKSELWLRLKRVPWGQFGHVLPEKLIRILDGGGTLQELLQAFENAVPDPVERIVLSLKLSGIERPFDPDDRRGETLALWTLARASQADMGAAVSRAVREPAALDGAVLWVFAGQQWGSLDRQVLERVLPALAERALGSGSARTRRITLAALGEIGGQQAIALLRSVLAKPFPGGIPRAGRAEEGAHVPWAFYLSDCPTDQDCAAVILARLGDRGSLPAIKKAASRAPFPQGRAFQQAIDSLEAEQGED